jgi:hypothetical protein
MRWKHEKSDTLLLLVTLHPYLDWLKMVALSKRMHTWEYVMEASWIWWLWPHSQSVEENGVHGWCCFVLGEVQLKQDDCLAKEGHWLEWADNTKMWTARAVLLPQRPRQDDCHVLSGCQRYLDSFIDFHAFSLVAPRQQLWNYLIHRTRVLQAASKQSQYWWLIPKLVMLHCDCLIDEQTSLMLFVM